MDQNNDWYERYSTYRPDESSARAVKRERRGVRGSTLVICMLAAILLGGLLGGLYTRQYVGEQIAALQSAQTQGRASQRGNKGTRRPTAALQARCRPRAQAAFRPEPIPKRRSLSSARRRWLA